MEMVFFSIFFSFQEMILLGELLDRTGVDRVSRPTENGILDDRWVRLKVRF